MKRISVLALFVVLLFGTSAAIFAQNNQQSASSGSSSRPEYFVKTIYLNKVYTDNLGYVVAYADSSNNFQEAYLPMSWFNTAGGKGVLVYGAERNYPYMDVYYENGKFDHVVLYVQSSFNDPSWAVLPQTANLEAKFKVDTLTLKY